MWLNSLSNFQNPWDIAIANLIRKLQMIIIFTFGPLTLRGIQSLITLTWRLLWSWRRKCAAQAWLGKSSFIHIQTIETTRNRICRSNTCEFKNSRVCRPRTTIDSHARRSRTARLVKLLIQYTVSFFHADRTSFLPSEHQLLRLLFFWTLDGATQPHSDIPSFIVS